MVLYMGLDGMVNGYLCELEVIIDTAYGVDAWLIMEIPERYIGVNLWRKRQKISKRLIFFFTK